MNLPTSVVAGLFALVPERERGPPSQGSHLKITRSFKDVRGRPIRTVVAKLVGEGAAAVMETRADHDTEAVLRAAGFAPRLPSWRAR
jgi:hypothetical protein